MIRCPARCASTEAVPKTAILGRRSVPPAGRTAATAMGVLLPRAYSVALRTMRDQMTSLSKRSAPPAITRVPSGWLALAAAVVVGVPVVAVLVVTAAAVG